MVAQLSYFKKCKNIIRRRRCRRVIRLYKKAAKARHRIASWKAPDKNLAPFSPYGFRVIYFIRFSD